MTYLFLLFSEVLYYDDLHSFDDFICAGGNLEIHTQIPSSHFDSLREPTLPLLQAIIQYEAWMCFDRLFTAPLKVSTVSFRNRSKIHMFFLFPFKMCISTFHFITSNSWLPMKISFLEIPFPLRKKRKKKTMKLCGLNP